MKPMLSVPDVAALIRKSCYTVQKMARLGQLPGAKKIGNEWRFSAVKIAHFIGEPVE